MPNDLIDPVATYRTGCATTWMVCLSGAMDAFDPDEPYTQIYLFDIEEPDWNFNEHDDVVSSICLWSNPADADDRYFAALCENGDVVIEDESLTHERISGAGIGRPDSKGYGYLNDIRQIGSHLYACGASGQVYRRNSPGNWAHMDDGLLQPPDTESGLYVPVAIAGPAEDSIYVVGYVDDAGLPPRADHWDGRKWHRVDMPSGAARLTNLYVESAKRIWMCGDNGTLLVGNAADGFVSVGPTADQKLIYSIALFRGVGFVGTNLGLFRFDPSRKGSPFRPVKTGLKPELVDANVVQSVDDEVLWSIGGKDIARFDGRTWTRYLDPDNGPLEPP